MSSCRHCSAIVPSGLVAHKLLSEHPTAQLGVPNMWLGLMHVSVQARRRQAAGLPSKSAAAATSGSALSRSASGRRRKRLYAKWPSGVGRRIWSCACIAGTGVEGNLGGQSCACMQTTLVPQPLECAKMQCHGRCLQLPNT